MTTTKPTRIIFGGVPLGISREGRLRSGAVEDWQVGVFHVVLFNFASSKHTMWGVGEGYGVNFSGNHKPYQFDTLDDADAFVSGVIRDELIKQAVEALVGPHGPDAKPET